MSRPERDREFTLHALRVFPDAIPRKYPILETNGSYDLSRERIGRFGAIRRRCVIRIKHSHADHCSNPSRLLPVNA